MELGDNFYLIVVVTGAVLICLTVLLVLIHRVTALIRNRAGSSDRKTEFLALAAHYFLTPLAIIRGNIAELLNPASQGLSESERQKYYVTIQANTNKLLLLIQNMILISSIDQGTLAVKQAPVDFVGEVDKCMADIHPEAMQKNQLIQFVRPEGVLVNQARLDTEKFHQALMNILSNAVKFTDAGGSIEVRVMEGQGAYTLTIADSGIGIAPEEMSRLFSRFHRGTSFLNFDYEGIGLGLYLTKYLIEANGGTVSVQSRLHRGTKVTVVVPIH